MRLGAVDSQLLLDVCDGDSTAEQVLFMIQATGFTPMLPPTATQEVFDIAVEDQLGIAMEAAYMLTRDRHDHTKVYSPPQLDGEKNGYVGIAADEMMERGFVHDKNLSLLIAESACLEANVLFLDDETLATIDRRGVNDVLKNRDLPTITIASWTQALQQG